MLNDQMTSDFGGGWWIILLFLFIFNGGMFRNGGIAENYVLSSDFANIERKIDGVNNGLCDGFYAMNSGMLNGFANVGYQIAETNRNIDSVNYNLQAQANAIMHNDCQNTQKILDAITTNQMSAMQSHIQQLELQSALCGVVRYPLQTTYAVSSPCFGGNGCSCGYNNYAI